jgi:uncharacterized membrane protein YfcA
VSGVPALVWIGATMILDRADAEGMTLLALTTFVASAINSVAGGGTILTFPVLAALLPDGPARLVTANATSTIGLWPGAVAAAWGYRSQRGGLPPWTRWLLPASVSGALLGASLVLALPPTWFSRAVPWLILAAAILFALQPRLSAIVRTPAPEASAPADGVASASAGVSGALFAAAWVLQFLVAVYGGYFGAGIGILMLAVLGSLDLGDIHRLNAVKNVLAMAVNGTPALVFAAAAAAPASAAVGPWGGTIGPGVVSWRHAVVMAVAAVLGGLFGAHLARRMPAALVRRAVALIGFGLAGYYFLRA